MKISIIIPVYNGEKFIKKCIESIYKYNVDNEKLEVIIINDGSKDKTLEICEKLNEKYGFNLYNIENSGVSSARNFGLTKSTHDYVMFVDADDFLDLDWYTKISKNEKCEDVIFINPYLKENKSKEEIILNILGIKESKYMLATPWAKLFKRKFLIDNNIKFTSSIINGEDMLFNIESIKKSKSHSYITESIYNYYVHPASATKRYDDKIILSDQLFHKKLAEILGDNNNSIYKYCIANAIFTICYRIACLEKYENEKFCFLNKEPYKFIRIINVLFIKHLNIKKKLLIIIARMKMYKVIYNVLRKKIKKSLLDAEPYYVKI